MQQRILRPTRAARAGGRPPWRLLMESRAPGVDIANFDAFRDAGFDVTVCEGPDESPDCPLVRGEPCPLVDEADVVLFDLDDLPARWAVLDALRASRPALPVVVRAQGPAALGYPGCSTIRTTTSVNGQVSALRKAVMRWTTSA